MSQSFATCSSCGAEITLSAQACPKCGHLVAPPAPPLPPAVPPPFQSPPPLTPPATFVPPLPPGIETQGEKVLRVIGQVKLKTGAFSSLLYHMVVTSERLIFAIQTKEMQKADVEAAKVNAKQQGKGFFGQIGAQMASRSGDKYLVVSPFNILAETAENFAIPYSELKVIETYSAGMDDSGPDTMVIKTLSDKLNFSISNAYSVNNELKPVLGNKVK